jgi:hypothetical protein
VNQGPRVEILWRCPFINYLPYLVQLINDLAFFVRLLNDLAYLVLLLYDLAYLVPVLLLNDLAYLLQLLYDHNIALCDPAYFVFTISCFLTALPTMLYDLDLAYTLNCFSMTLTMPTVTLFTLYCFFMTLILSSMTLPAP